MTRCALPLLVLLLLFLPLVVWADEGPILNPELLQVTEHNLDNGLQVLLLEDHSAPVLTYQVYYRVGSRHEKTGTTGLAHFFEHMMFRGSTKYGPEEHDHIVQAHGGYCNANTWYDRTAYYENIASDQLELVAHLEAERLANLQIVPETFNPERQIVYEERLERVDNNLFGSLIEQVTTTMFQAHPYGWPVVGWGSDILGWEQQELEEFYHTYYIPNNSTVIVVGDFDTQEAIELIEHYYGDIPAGPDPIQPRTVEPEQHGERRVMFHRPAQVPIIVAGYHIPGAAHEDMPALEVAQKILSDGRSSRIYRTMIYEEQVSPYAGGFIYPLRDPGIFMVYAGVNMGIETEQVETTLFNLIDDLANNPVSEEELQKAQNQLESDFIMELTTVYGRARAIGEALILYDGDYNRFINRPAEYRAVTLEDVQRVIGTYLTERNRTTVILVPDNPAPAPSMGMTEGGE